MVGIVAVLSVGPGAVATAEPSIPLPGPVPIPLPIPSPGGVLNQVKSGFDCQEVPSPEFPSEATASTFDDGGRLVRSATNPDSPDRATADDTSQYATYGWAGLTWHTYDLGCGPDLTRAPIAVADTTLGNRALKAGQTIAGVAFWLDRQTKTPDQAHQVGETSLFDNFDKIILSVSESVKAATFGPWMSLALAAAGAIILWRALRADVANVTKQLLLGGVALGMGALLVGAPQEAIKLSDDTFNQLITGQQEQIFASAHENGRPRDVILDQIFIPEYSRGYFGNIDPKAAADLEPRLRNSLAFSYAEQDEIKRNPDRQQQLVDEKAKQFQEVVDDLKQRGLNYRVFQGKDADRTSIGITATIKVAAPSLLWSGCSLLKLVALLAIRLAILTAPIWIPFTAVSARLMERVWRTLLGAYFWGIVSSVILGVFLLALVKLYGTGDISAPWKFWVMLLLTVIAWAVIRPIKRISTIARNNSASLINRRGATRKAAAMAGLFEAAVAAKAMKARSKAASPDDDDAPDRPEGRAVRTANLHRNAAEQAAAFIYDRKVAKHRARRTAGIDTPETSGSVDGLDVGDSDTNTISAAGIPRLPAGPSEPITTPDGAVDESVRNARTRTARGETTNTDPRFTFRLHKSEKGGAADSVDPVRSSNERPASFSLADDYTGIARRFAAQAADESQPGPARDRARAATADLNAHAEQARRVDDAVALYNANLRNADGAEQ